MPGEHSRRLAEKPTSIFLSEGHALHYSLSAGQGTREWKLTPKNKGPFSGRRAQRHGPASLRPCSPAWSGNCSAHRGSSRSCWRLLSADRSAAPRRGAPWSTAATAEPRGPRRARTKARRAPKSRLADAHVVKDSTNVNNQRQPLRRRSCCYAHLGGNTSLPRRGM